MTPLSPLNETAGPGVVRRTYPVTTPAQSGQAAKLARDIISPLPSAPRNNLGASFHERGPVVMPELKAFAQIHLDELIAEDDLAILLPAHAELLKEQAFADSHSAPILARKESAALEEYARTPSDEALKKLREIRSLTNQDHSLIQHCSKERRLAIFTRITPTCKTILLRGADILAEHATRLEESDREHYFSVGCKPLSHPLALGLAQLSRNLRNEASATVPFNGMPELVHQALQAAEARRLGVEKAKAK